MMQTNVLRSEGVRKLIDLALFEDLSGGDLTSALTIPSGHRSIGEIVARQPLLVCGVPLISTIFEQMKASVDLDIHADEGVSLKAGAKIATLRGETQTLLSAERTLLNFLQRLSGVATHTATLVAEAGKLELLDTRKTMPGWRLLDKYATRVGGARNHRMHLSDLIMVKDNHVDASALPLDLLLKKVCDEKPSDVRVEVEVRDVDELKLALRAPIDIVLLDNMTDEQLRECVQVIEQSGVEIEVEASGGITAQRFQGIYDAGVAMASLGSLTTQAVNVDIAMDITGVL